MRINLITYNNEYGLTQDVNVLVYQLKRHFRDRVEIFAVNFFDYKCNYVDLNIFLETVSFTLFKYAPINILIPNQEWYYKSWIPYIKYFDKILVKSNYSETIFKQLLSSQKDNPKKVIKIGWQSKDKMLSKYKKDFNKYLHVCGKSKHKQTQAMVDNWLPEFPHLDLIYSPRDVVLKEKEQDNITYHRERLSDTDLTKLLNECGVHLCCSDTEGFGHYIQEAKSVKSIIITVNAPPMNNFVDESFGFLVKHKLKKPLKKALGSKFIVDGNNFQELIKNIMKLTNDKPNKLNEMGELARKSYLDTCQVFKDTIKDVFRDIFQEAIKIGKEYKTIKEEEDKRIEEMIKDDNLPSISVITPTYNRPHMFRIALYNYINFNYPRNKIQWVIVDDGDEDKRVSHMIPDEEGVNIKYIALDKRVTIGMKRNICIENSDNDIIVCMDDDDLYPSNSLKIRVLELLRSKKKCVTCTTIACFHINKLISMINVPPHKMSFSERISEATLCFYKSFWEEQKFRESCHIGEAKDFLQGRVDDCYEISWEGIIVSLMHNRNISGKITMGDTPNGCHYGWDDKLYLFITNLDTEINEEEQQQILDSRQGKFKFATDYQFAEFRDLNNFKSQDEENTNETTNENTNENNNENTNE
jgi:glycosyltransferase involved in cell wall biosynthesis